MAVSRRSHLSQAEHDKRWVAWTSVFAAVALTSTKLLVGLQTNSLGILSEAAHSGLDLVAAMLTLFAVRMSARPADRDHTYGHGKVENLSALAQTVLLLATSVWIVIEAVERLFFSHVQVDANAWAFAVVLFSIGVDFSRSRALMRVARKYGSPALEADAFHFSTDLWSSGAVFLGLIGVWAATHFGIPFLARADAAAALVVAAIVLWVCVKLGRRNINDLLDAVSPALRSKVEDAARVPGVLHVQRVRVRHAGPEVFVDLTLTVPRDTPLEQAHDTTARAEAAVRRILPNADVVVRVDPAPGQDESLLTTLRLLAARHELGIHDVHLHDVMGRQGLDMHVEVSEGLNLAEAYQRVSRFEEALRREFPSLESVVTHLEPVGDGSIRQAALPGDAERIEHALREICEEIRIGFHPHDLAVRRIEGRLSVSFHCELHPSARLTDAHDFTEELERRLRLRLPDLDRVVIHVEPIRERGPSNGNAGRYEDPS